MAEKKFEKMLKKRYEFEPRLVPVDQNGPPAANNGESNAANGAVAGAANK